MDCIIKISSPWHPLWLLPSSVWIVYAAKVLRVAPRRQAGQGCVWIVYAAAYIWLSFSSALVAPSSL